MGLVDWHYWLIVGIVMFIAEIFTTGFFIMWFGVGAFVAALVAALGAGLTAQLISFVVVSLVLTVSSRTIFKRFFLGRAQGRELATNVDALVGATAVVKEQIDNDKGEGLVKIGGEEWSAVSEDGSVIPPGSKVQVVRIEGVKAVVREERIKVKEAK